MKVALTIAGSDSSGGAGIQADLKTFHAHGVYGMSVVTAVTVQNTVKVFDVQEMDEKIVFNQIACLFDDIRIDVVKIGMVSSIGLIKAVASALDSVSLPPVVLDPVMISKSGYSLLQQDAQKSLVENLFPFAQVVTPNIFEAEALTGRKISGVEEMRRAASDIVKIGVKNVVVKGGHLDKGPATDVLYDGHEYRELSGRRIKTKNTHGTGCTFSSAIAANIAMGKDFFKAAALAREYITGAIEHSLSIGKGHGPTHHFYKFFNIKTNPS